MGGEDCAVCLCSKVAPVRWPGQCSHSFCERCCLSVLERGTSQCPLCRTPLDGAFAAAEVLVGKVKLERDADAAAAARAADPDEYDQREAADAVDVQAMVERLQYVPPRPNFPARIPCTNSLPPAPHTLTNARALFAGGRSARGRS